MDIKRLIPMLLLLGAIVAFGFFMTPKKETPEAPSQPTEEVVSNTTPSEDTSTDATPEADTESQETSESSELRPAPEPTVTATSTPTGDRWHGAGDAERQARTVTIGSLDPDATYAVAYTFSNVGAGVESARLKEFFVTEADKRAFDKDPEAYTQLLTTDPEKYKGHYRLLEPVKLNGNTLRALATRHLRVQVEGVDTIPPIDLSQKPWKYEGVSTAEDGVTQTVAFSYTVFYGKTATSDNAILKITKHFTLQPETYSLTLRVTLENLSGKTVLAGFDQIGATSLQKEDPRTDGRRLGYGRAVGDKDNIQVRLDKDLHKMGLGQVRSVGRTDSAEPVVWAGTTNKYFASLVYAQPKSGVTSDAHGIALSARMMKGDFYEQRTGGDATALTGVWVGTAPTYFANTGSVRNVAPSMQLNAGASRDVAFTVFTGPKDVDVFTKVTDPLHQPLYAQLNFMSAIDFAGCFCNIQWLSLKMMWLLGALSKLMFGNYGLGIILLVLLVRFALHPLTKKSQVSMMKMQKLQPEMQRLKEKYADDKETLNREMMRSYKEQGASPLLGCLPMLLQMPILIAMFTGINATVALRHAAFLPVWLTDLAAPDALVSWSVQIPFISKLTGNQFNLLPILLCVVMFLQTKMNPSMNAASASGSNDQMAQQQKMMKFMMPAMMLVFFYHAPSGLTLYFMASTAAGLVDQWAVRRHIRKQDEEAAATETIIDAPGKASRGNRPKKAKPMFKTGM